MKSSQLPSTLEAFLENPAAAPSAVPSVAFEGFLGATSKLEDLWRRHFL